MSQKSMKNRLTNLMKQMLGFGWVSGGFLVDSGDVFGTLDLQKWVSGVREVLFFKKSHFFDQIWFGSDF